MKIIYDLDGFRFLTRIIRFRRIKGLITSWFPWLNRHKNRTLFLKTRKKKPNLFTAQRILLYQIWGL